MKFTPKFFNLISFLAIVAGGVLIGHGTNWDIGTGAALLTWANFKTN